MLKFEIKTYELCICIKYENFLNLVCEVKLL